ncbi:unnamed protein product, partial [Allacma fusca]
PRTVNANVPAHKNRKKNTPIIFHVPSHLPPLGKHTYIKCWANTNNNRKSRLKEKQMLFKYTNGPGVLQCRGSRSCFGAGLPPAMGSEQKSRRNFFTRKEINGQ